MQKQSFSVSFSPLPVPHEEALYFDKAPVPLPYSEGFDKLHYHDRYEIGICESGDGLFLLEDEVYYLTAGDTIFIAPRRRHYSRSLHEEEPCLCRFAYLDATKIDALLNFVFQREERAERILMCAAGLFTPIFSPESEEAVLLTSFMMSAREESPYALEEGELALAHFLCRLAHSENALRGEVEISHPRDSRIASCVEYIATHYDRGDTITKLLSLSNLSESQLRRHFLKELGMPPIAYRNLLRCKIASTLLTNTEMPIGEIASRVGFGDVSDFYRAFSKHYGTAPSAYRRMGEQ